MMSALKLLLWSLLCLGGFRIYRKVTEVPEMPKLESDPWWAPGEHQSDNTDIKPFTINVSQEDLDDLKMRLTIPLRYMRPLENANFTYGFSGDILKAFQNYWGHGYNWWRRELRMNKLNHFRTQIEGLDIHFIHMKPRPEVLGPNTKVVPLLLSHGWPGSFVEFDEIIPLLTQPWGKDGEIAFEIVVPSLPGYGFSQAASKQGLGSLETAQIFLKLMKRLNFEKFYVQGGDWGAFISSTMATLYPEHVLGVHVNMIAAFSPTNSLKHLLGAYLPSGFLMSPQDEEQMYPASDFFSRILMESGYFHLQATKPDTIGNALSNSPMSLAVHILEKFSTWTHKGNVNKRDGGLLDAFPISMDRLLDNICIYWFTNSITSSVRYYKESLRAMPLGIDRIPCKVPAGLAAFPQEIANSPESFASVKFSDLVSYTRMPKGGHFAAMEQPELLAEDIHKFVTTVEKRSHEKREEL